MRFPRIILASILLAACSNGGPTAVVEAPVPAGIQEVRATMAFGDSPLVGELRIKPIDDDVSWSYSIDLDEDGQAEEAGALRLGVSVTYRFEDPGPHRIRIDLERDGAHHRLDRIVVVNDPRATGLLGVVSLQSESGTTLGAIAVDDEDQRLFVVDESGFLLYQLRTSDLTTAWRASLPAVFIPGGYISTQGIALYGDSLLVDVGDSLMAVRVSGDHAILGRVADAHWGQFLHLRRDRLLYVGGHSGIALLDPRTGTVLAAREEESFSGHFAVARDGERIALVQGFPSPSVKFLDRDDLTEERRVGLGTHLSEPFAISFNADGDRLYLLFRGEDWRLIVMETATGRILKEVIIGRGGSDTFPSNPAATSADGRFVVFSTPLGAFFIDTRLDLPRFRTAEQDPVRIGCCNVVASPRDNVFYFADPFSETVSKVALLR